MKWKGTEPKTAGDVMDALIACETPQEARKFMDLYRAS